MHTGIIEFLDKKEKHQQTIEEYDVRSFQHIPSDTQNYQQDFLDDTPR